MIRKIVIVIVLGLLGLVALGIFQMYRKDRAKWDYMAFNEVVIGLRNYYADETTYPARDVSELKNLGCIHDASVAFINRGDVKFSPFSSDDPPSKKVLEMRLLGHDLIATKEMIVSPPADTFVRSVTELTFDLNRVLSPPEKSAVFGVMMDTLGHSPDRTCSSIDFTTHTIVDVEPITDHEAFVAALDLGEIQMTSKRRYRLVLDEAKLKSLVQAKFEDSEQDATPNARPPSARN